MKSGWMCAACLVVRNLRQTTPAALIAVVVFSMSAWPSTHARQAGDPRDFAAWLSAVNTHVPGATDESLTRVASWSRGRLESLLSHVSRQRLADRVGIVERALVLHTDIAIARRAAEGYRDLPSTLDTATLFRDGQVMGQTTGTFHWEFARRLLDQLPRGDDRLRIGRQFYRATAAVLQSWSEYSELLPHLAAARRLIGDDAVLLMYEGTLRQAHAGPRMQRFFDDRERAARDAESATSGVRSTRAAIVSIERRATPADLLTQAEGLFRRAISLDPALTEARIRLAHVLSDRGRQDDATAELVQAIETPLPPLLDYYASLVIGRVARARGDLDAARLAFERAATIFPLASAPMYGLSELAIARGDRAQGLEYLLRARVHEQEPWWRLDRVHAPSANDLVEDMRRAVTP